MTVKEPYHAAAQFRIARLSIRRLCAQGALMRVLHILDHASPPTSAYAMRVMTILQHQRAMGWQTWQMTGLRQGAPVPADEHDDTIEELAPLVANPLAACRCNDVDDDGGADAAVTQAWTFFRTRPPSNLLERIPFFGALHVLTRRLDEVVRLTRPSILHAHSPAELALAALRVGRRHGVPVVFEVHAPSPHAQPGATWSATPALVRGALTLFCCRWIEAWAARRADAVVTNSEGVRARLIRQRVPAGTIKVVADGVAVPADATFLGRRRRPRQQHTQDAVEASAIEAALDSMAVMGAATAAGTPRAVGISVYEHADMGPETGSDPWALALLDDPAGEAATSATSPAAASASQTASLPPAGGVIRPTAPHVAAGDPLRNAPSLQRGGLPASERWRCQQSLKSAIASQQSEVVLGCHVDDADMNAEDGLKRLFAAVIELNASRTPLRPRARLLLSCSSAADLSIAQRVAARFPGTPAVTTLFCPTAAGVVPGALPHGCSALTAGKPVRPETRIDLGSPHEQMVLFHRSADVIVFAGEGRHPEAAPCRRLLQAMAAACVTAAADVPANRSLISHGQNGVLYDIAAEAALSDTLGTLIANRANWPTLSAGARWFIEFQRNWSSCAAHYDGLYRRLMEKRRRRR